MTARERPPVRAVIGLGSNLGDKRASIEDAISRLTADGAVVEIKRSPLYRTAPWGLTDQDWFVNACMLAETRLSARGLLERCLAVEQALGRVRDRRWGPRVIDLDILLYGEEVIDEPGLVAPHPEIAKRAFVLVPLVDVAPDARIGGMDARALLEAIDRADVVPL